MTQISDVHNEAYEKEWKNNYESIFESVILWIFVSWDLANIGSGDEPNQLFLANLSLLLYKLGDMVIDNINNFLDGEMGATMRDWFLNIERAVENRNKTK